MVTAFNYSCQILFPEYRFVLGKLLLLYVVCKPALTNLHRYFFSCCAGVPRYPSPYATMVRPAFPLRPPGSIGMLPALSRPPVPGIPGVRPVMPPVVRPAIALVAAPTEKPLTTVYVGKIASTVENDFMLSLLQVGLFIYFNYFNYLFLI